MINVFYPINSLSEFTIIRIPNDIYLNYYCGKCNNDVRRGCNNLTSSGSTTICGVIKTKGMEELVSPLLYLSIYNIIKFRYNEKVP